MAYTPPSFFVIISFSNLPYFRSKSQIGIIDYVRLNVSIIYFKRSSVTERTQLIKEEFVFMIAYSSCD